MSPAAQTQTMRLRGGLFLRIYASQFQDAYEGEVRPVFSVLTAVYTVDLILGTYIPIDFTAATFACFCFFYVEPFVGYNSPGHTR